MNDAAWERLVDAVDVSLGVTDHGRTVRPLEDRPDLTQTVEHIEFHRDGQEYRLERSTGPAIVDRKTHYHRAGTANRVEYIYDPHEVAHKVTLCRRSQGGGWEPVELDQLAL